MKKLLVLALGIVMMFAVVGCNKNERSSEVKSFTGEELAQIISDCGSEMTQYNEPKSFDDENGMGPMFLESFEADPSIIEAGAISYSMMNVKAYAIMIVKPAEGKAEDVKTMFENDKNINIQNFTNYLADQLEIAENAIIEEVNGYIVYVMTDDAETVFNAISEKLK